MQADALFIFGDDGRLDFPSGERTITICETALHGRVLESYVRRDDHCIILERHTHALTFRSISGHNTKFSLTDFKT